MERKKVFLFSGLFTIIFFVADRIFKRWFFQNPQTLGDFMNGIISFHFVKNYGIAFGWFDFHSGFFQKVLTTIIVSFFVFVIFFIFHEWKKQNSILFFFLCCIAAGAFSNLLDRFYFGYVIDYIDVSFFTVFNIADSMITFGACGIILYEIFVFLKMNRKKDIL